MVGDDAERVGIEINLETLDEAAGHFESLGYGLEILQQERAVDPDIQDQILDPMRLPVGESGDEVQDTAELFGGAHGGESERRRVGEVE